MTLALSIVGPESAADVHDLIHAAFGAREAAGEPLDPPSTALSETVESVRASLEEHGGVLALRDDKPVGSLLFEPHDKRMGMRRVAVDPAAQGDGVAKALVRRAEQHAAALGYPAVQLQARAELPATVRFWVYMGYGEVDHDGTLITMAKELPFTVHTVDADQTRAVGERLAHVVRAADVLILSGDLGAGKTTFTQGLGAGLGVRGDITSPTFVIARVHPTLADGPALVHVDAYRLGESAELDDLDLDTSLDDSVTVVEWGSGIAEGLADERLEIRIKRSRDDSDERALAFKPIGARWVDSGVHAAVTAQ